MGQIHDTFGLDSHKLHFHVQRVADWLKGKNVYPIYMEISPSGACNHRCTFCGLDFMKYRPRFLPTNIIKKRLTELGRLGIKSIMYAGEGEPFLHKDMIAITRHGKSCGIDAAFTTNGVLMTPEKIEGLLPVTSWIKVSCNAGTPETYAQIHRAKPKDFHTVFSNLNSAVTLRRKNDFQCTLGLQMLLLPENYAEAEDLARRCRDTGLDYLVIKPYSQHPSGRSTKYKSISYNDGQMLAKKLKQYCTEDFNVIVRLNTMEKWNTQERDYERCCALPFWSYIDAGGNVWGCSVYLGNEKFHYGNILKHSFEEIWTGKKRQQSLQMIRNILDPSTCRINCRMDKINTFLWQLKNPPAHVNFI